MVQIKVESVRNPRWSNQDGSMIDCLVKTNTLLTEAPFTASIHDPEPHGREIYRLCVEGKFGPIAPMETTESLDPEETIVIPAEFQQLEPYLRQANLENFRKSPRSIILVWSILIDNMLTEILKLKAGDIAVTGKNSPKLPKFFGQRIAHAKNLELIDEIEADKCKHILQIRNQAAHELDISLESQVTLSSLRALYEADHSNLLVFHEDLEFLIQQVYAGSCAMLAIRLIDRKVE